MSHTGLDWMIDWRQIKHHWQVTCYIYMIERWHMIHTVLYVFITTNKSVQYFSWLTRHMSIYTDWQDTNTIYIIEKWVNNWILINEEINRIIKNQFDYSIVEEGLLGAGHRLIQEASILNRLCIRLVLHQITTEAHTLASQCNQILPSGICWVLDRSGQFCLSKNL